MSLPPFVHEVPASLQEALELLDRHGDAASLYLGGTELLLILKMGLAQPDVLVDGKRLAELRGIASEGDTVAVGAASTHRELETSPQVRELVPAFARLSAHVANPRVRNVGTIGGNLCFAEPHSDPATLLTALDATVELAASTGTRRVPLHDFYEGALATVLRDGEIMTRIRIPVPRGAHVAYERIVFHERPVANAALYLDGDDVRIVVGAVAGRPGRIAAAEQLVRERAEPAAVAEAVSAAVDPLEDQHGSADYKRHLAGVAVSRCLGATLATA